MTFSIIIPTYNRSALLRFTLESLLQQSYSNFEIIVVDDGGTDDTEDMIAAFGSEKIKYFKKVNGERGAARNYGAAKARGDYLNFFDSDDIAYPNHLETALGFIETHPHAEVFHLNYDAKRPDGSLVYTGKFTTETFNKQLILDNKLSCNGVFIKNEIARLYPFPEDRRLAVSEDWTLWLQLAARYPIYVSKVITSSVILHDQRSINDWNPDKVITRDLLMINYLRADDVFMKCYSKKMGRFTSDRYTFFMLLLSLHKRRKEVLHYALKAIKSDVRVIFRRRFLASLKKIIF